MDFARLVDCIPNKLPFIYLGLPVGQNMPRIVSWKLLKDKFQKKEI